MTAQAGLPPSPWATTDPREALRDNNGGRVISMTPGITPSPGGAYPANMVDFCGYDENYVQDVHFTGQKAMVLRSRTQHVHNGGSGGVCEPIGHAPQVRAGGSPVIRHGDRFYMDNRKTVGEAQFARDTASYAAPVDSDPLRGSGQSSGQVGGASGAARISRSGDDPSVQKAEFFFLEVPWWLRVAPEEGGELGGGRTMPDWARPQPEPSPPGGAPRTAPRWPETGPFPPAPPVAPDTPTFPDPQTEPETGREPDVGNARITPDKCPFLRVCFYPSDRLDLAEYRRQLKMQEDVLNAKTPSDYLHDRADFEDPMKRAQIDKDLDQARDRFWRDYRDQNLPSFQRQYGIALGYLKYQQSIRDLAALHRLDTVAGGNPKDIAREVMQPTTRRSVRQRGNGRTRWTSMRGSWQRTNAR